MSRNPGGNDTRPQSHGSPLHSAGEASQQNSANLDIREFRKLLPTEDPKLPFDLAEFLQQPTRHNSQASEAEFSRVLAMVSASASTHPQVPQTPSVRSHAAWLGNTDQPIAPSSRRAKKRTDLLLWKLTGLLLCIAGFLALLLLWQPNPQQIGGSDTLATNPAAPPSTGVPAEPETRPRRSGLPPVQGLDDNARNQLDALAATESALPDEARLERPSELSAAETPEVTEAEAIAVESMPAPNKPPVQNQAAQPPVELTETERLAWAKTLAGISNLIGSQKFAEAEAEITAAQAAVQTAEQSSQVSRLSTIRQLAQQFCEAMRQAAAEMDAGEVFTIGSSTPVSLVEATDDRIIVRMRGQNQSFLFTEIPIGLAFGLVDLEMDATSPETKARKAAFAIAHPGAATNGLVLKRAKQLMSEAVAAGVVSEELMKELPE